MELDTYIHRLESFISHLPDSDIMFLYFVVKNRDVESIKYTPRINTQAKKWNLEGIPLYIIPGGKGYCYVYKENAIQYKVYLNKGKVSGFDKQETSYGTIGGSGKNIISNVHLGNHLTIGINTSYTTGEIILVTHLTSYIPDTKHPSNSHRDSLECNFFLTDTLDKTTDCIQFGKPRGQKIEIYEGVDKLILPVLKSIHHILWNNTVTGGKKSRLTKTRLYTGSKGGTYKLVKGRRVYIGGNRGFKDPQSGGFVSSFVEFVKEMLLDKVSSYRSNLDQAMVIDDGSDHLMIRYIFRERYNDLSSVFMMERNMLTEAWLAYTKPNQLRTKMEIAALTTFTSVVDGFRSVIMSAA